ncbi:GNAT family N-acetyltransferase [Saccharobesus litoralis]|uniref:GNAT family N-acetyltransferase n=1 Tax=Saccharobesus litoralis TaxID=2172099 RepID=A0A2S0VSD0_9ALTE|nr:GNAT family N-acetyltransferase [Saccharobesus litoralis]AWB67126.1 GNAT family N-acetyltransferase [Saccharobesus litoralis]
MENSLDWQIKTYSQLTKDELYQILHLRQRVFMLEQASLYLDLDNKDQQSVHLFACEHAKHGVVAYLRLVIPTIEHKEQPVYFARFALEEKYRSQGIGKTLFEKGLKYAAEQWPNQSLALSAQLGLQNYYSKYGFVVVSTPYDDGGVMHIDMVKPAKVDGHA